MSKTILAEVEGFTPLIDSIVRDLGLMSAAVFGRVWRYCQGERGICAASIETIAKELGISYATTQRHLQELVNKEYLTDTTPGLRNHPHQYADTGKAGLSIKIAPSESASGKNPLPQKARATISESASTPSESASGSRFLIDEDRIQVKKESKKQGDIVDGVLRFAKTGETDIQQAIQDIFRISPNWTRRAEREFLRWAVQIPDFSEKLRKFSAWWKDKDWRGKKGQPPTLDQIREMWLQSTPQKQQDEYDYAALRKIAQEAGL